MKSCPTCKRTYPDDTLAFCLADGALLSAPYDTSGTIQITQSQAARNASTEILSAARERTNSTPSNGRRILPYIGIGFAMLLLGGSIASIIIWRANLTTTTAEPQANVNGVPTATAQPSVERAEINAIEIDATAAWVDTGVTLSEGERFSIEASGAWANSGENPGTYGPNGLNNTWPGTVLDSANNGSLIGKVNGTVFPVGEHFSGYAPVSGRLYLSMNDVPGTYGDNLGSVVARVTHGGK